MELLKKSLIRKILPRRSPSSHKGQNGRVLIIGGSLEYFGAPILSALGALSSGCDLVILLVPEVNFDVSRSFYPDFIVRKYSGNSLNLRALDVAKYFFETSDAVLIGPGLGENDETLHTVTKLLDRAMQPVVLDADALPAIHSIQPRENRPIVITPHVGEFNELIEENVSPDLSEEEKGILLQKYAEKWNATILLKGPHDYIVPAISGSSSLDSTSSAPPLLLPTAAHEIYINETGNAGMTVGGTGDVLAGIITSFISQGLSPFKASCIAAFTNGLAGDTLLRSKGFSYSATDVALEIPYTLHSLY